MAEIFFTESDIFYPEAYEDLDVAKRINYIAIGGGGAGASAQWKNIPTKEAVDGGITSIGNYVICNGGKTSIEGATTDSDSGYYPKSGQGGDGYVLHDSFNINISRAGTNGYFSTTKDNLPEYIHVKELSNYYVAYATAEYMNVGISSKNTTTVSSGTRGKGYGAGGNGAIYTYAAGNGGNAGQLKAGSFTLSSMNAIPIIIGQGGTPASITADNNAGNLGTSGTSGAVLLWW